MSWPRFAAANAAGALVWAVVVAVVGYSGGHAWAVLRDWLGTWAWVVAGVGLAAVFAWWAVRRRGRKVSGIRTNPGMARTARDEPDTPRGE